MIAESAMASEAIALAQHEEDLLETAVREHTRLVYRIAYSVFRNPADAEDATQETFLRVSRYGRKLARIEDRKAWLARIAWRVAVARQRQTKPASIAEERSADALPSPDAAADVILLERERGILLERMIAALPDALREPLVLSTLEELSPREVGSILGISEAAVRSRTFRARQILRERLGKWIGPRK